MPRRTRRRGPGRPTTLTPERRARIIGLIEDGNHLRTACAAAGVGESTFYGWLTKGEDAKDEAERTGRPVPDAQRVYAEFVEAVSRARARAEVKAVSVVERSMVGGFVTSEKPLVDVDGQAVQDPHTGEVLYERTYQPPDGRLALAYLERARPQEWSRAQSSKVEVSGPGGGPVPVEQTVIIASLAERVAAVVAEREADRELEAAEAGADGAYQITSGDDDD